MCVQYWPAGKNREEVYSGIGVTVENEEQLANFMIRTIRMRKVREQNIILPRNHVVWKSPKKVAFEIFNFDTFHQFLSLQNWPVW